VLFDYSIMFCGHCKQICVAFEELVRLLTTGRHDTLGLRDRMFKNRLEKTQASMEKGCEFCTFMVHCLEADPRFETMKASSKESSIVTLRLGSSKEFNHHRRADLYLFNLEGHEGGIYVPIEICTKDGQFRLRLFRYHLA
jgi:hypothetical protein